MSSVCVSHLTPAPPSPVPRSCVSRSADLYRRIARLRYDVYCVERGFLDPAEYPAGYENDEYDRFSIPVAVEDRGDVVAALRLVLDSPLGFPLEARARGLAPAYARVDRARAAEISRLVVARAYRRDAARGGLGASCPVLLRLFRQLYAESRRLGLTYWLAAMEPALERWLRRLVGIEFASVGASMDYYGEVVPYGASILDVERALHGSMLGARRRESHGRVPTRIEAGLRVLSREQAGGRESAGAEETHPPHPPVGTDE